MYCVKAYLGATEAHPRARKLTNGSVEADNEAMKVHNTGVEDLTASDAEPHHDDDDPDPHEKAGSGYVRIKVKSQDPHGSEKPDTDCNTVMRIRNTALTF